MRSWSVAKGHGTQNDFVVMVDRHGMANPSPADVRFLCDRRAGLGGDGLLRAIKAEHIDDWDGDPGLWFMDYRNADGSVSEMCGNGVRVFAKFLVEEGLASGSVIPIATRAGLRPATMLRDGRISVHMGPVVVDDQTTDVRLGATSWPAAAVDVGNPHAVCPVADVDVLDLRGAPQVSRTRFPNGVNVEFVQPVADHHIRMRVLERGVGETRSCGTGVVAAAAATSWGNELGDGLWRVDVPGGTLEVTLSAGAADLCGPAVIVAIPVTEN